MRLSRLDLTRYGKFTGHVIDFGEPAAQGVDLHVIYGLNEAGKSTALAGYLDLLFGIEERSRYGFLHQYNTMEVGAVLEADGKRHELRRVKQRGASLRDGSGQPVNEAVIGGALAGLSRDSYRMMFSLDDQTLEEGGNAILDSRGDLGELLFSASAGLAGLSKALAAVDNEADGIFRKRASSTRIAALKRRLGDLKASREKIDVQANVYATLVAGLKRAEQAYDDAVRECGREKARQHDLGRLIRAAPLAAEHSRVSAELGAVGDLPRPPGHWAAELPQLMTDDATLRTRLQGADGRIEQLRTEIDAIKLNRELLQLGERLNVLPELLARFDTAEADLPKRRAALLVSESRLAALAHSLTGQADATEPGSLAVAAATVGKLRGLLEERSGIEIMVKAAVTELDAALLALERAADDRAALDQGHPALDAGRKAALRALVSRMREGDLFARHRVAARVLLPLKRALDDALGALAPWSEADDTLSTLAAPGPEQIQAWRTALADQDQRRARHSEKRRDWSTKRAELEARIRAAEVGTGQIGDAEAAVLRHQREQSWVAHKQRLDGESASFFERLMRAVDEMEAARLLNADAVAELRGLHRELTIAEARIEREAELLVEIDREVVDLAAQIGRACPLGIGQAGEPAQRIAELEAWIKNRDAAIAASQECRKAEAEIEALAEEIGRERGRIAEAVRSAGVNPEGLDVPALLQAAEALLATDATQAQARASADEAVKDCSRTAETRRKACEAAAKADKDWQERWARALAGAWFEDRAADFSAVRAILEVLAGLPAQLEERDNLLHRIEAMEQDRGNFLSELAGLLGALGESLDPNTASASARALMDRFAAAKRNEELRASKAGELATLEEQRRTLVAEIEIHNSRKAELLEFFGVPDLARVSVSLQRCAQRDRGEEELKKIAAQLLQETGQSSLEGALAALVGIDAAKSARESAECATRIEALDERVKSLFADKSRAAERLAEIGGDDAVARIEAERKTVMLQIEDAALHYLRMKTGGLLAERALHAYRDKHRGSMMRRASEAFRVMTRGDYSGLATRPEKEQESLIGLPRQGGSKLATDMSKGTRFQLYLALRLAGYEEFASARPAVPFVADDIMETFDEPRSKEVFKLLGKMSIVGQVIYLTHHRHLCDIAMETVPGARIHELPP